MRERVLTALVLIPVVLAALFLASPYPIAILAGVVAAIGGTEIKRMLRDESWIPAVAGPMIVILAAAQLLSGTAATSSLAWAGLALFVTGICSAFVVARVQLWQSLGTVFAGGWVAGPLLSLIALHTMHSKEEAWNFATPVLLAIVPLWGGDTAAIFAGKAWGKHLLAPTISPKKTWEGSIANLLACIAVAVALAMALGLSWQAGVACGVCAGVLGQAGDLFESYIKRKAGLKDSGSLLPGHGGIMDRIDSILFTAPAVALILLR